MRTNLQLDRSFQRGSSSTTREKQIDFLGSSNNPDFFNFLPDEPSQQRSGNRKESRFYYPDTSDDDYRRQLDLSLTLRNPEMSEKPKNVMFTSRGIGTGDMGDIEWISPKTHGNVPVFEPQLDLSLSLNHLGAFGKDQQPQFGEPERPANTMIGSTFPQKEDGKRPSKSQSAYGSSSTTG
ncbi:hypothetical protein PTTG_28495 [Puccinia triticina 1-1 BBBD Race 1]|uniref:Uncharacterized protein n=2 Tax=Puccinia triticina TaxID=208348 RepID=A0A180GAY5_PUCT1|nr:uncharacterized protein PtA15_4A424 [Puccinia triticina]OAV89887.1 hypothetical protein PTTG_28495 [Puccinia triticina 1-1 BBBD Race 1]WAQ83973.1 hypothetical protein PtA15_4A424 [Puccinia triticina]WAR54823.1 hypothetical protein PtB15_4B441 [Puccinia triticina]